MSHITIAEQGLKAMEASDWETAVSKLTTGLKHSENPTWLLNRSKALTRLNRSEEALADAELAWHYALARSKRELVAEANYRRAVAFHRLGQYANAAFCCSYSMRMNKGVSPLVPNEDPFQDFVDENGNCTMTQAGAKEEAAKDDYNKRNDSIGGTANMTPSKKIGDWRLASTLKMQVLARMEASPADDPGRKVTTTQKPERKPFSDLGLGGEGKTAPQPSKQKQATPTATSTAAAAAAAAAASQPAKPAVPSNARVRLDDFQNDTTMSVTIFSKGNDKSKLQVEFLPFSVRLDPIKYPSGEEKEFSLNLWGEIDVESSKHTVTPSKVELSLKKKTPGKWPQLRGETPAKSADEQLAEAKEKEILDHLKEERKKAMDEVDATQAEDATTAREEDIQPTVDKDKGKAPAPSSYPTSSRSGPKNWDKLDGVDSDEEESNVNVFFKKLYKNATPEQQRAMMKSFTESNGTSLSTDWNDVGSRTVETVPPEGVEAKKWDK